MKAIVLLRRAAFLSTEFPKHVFKTVDTGSVVGRFISRDPDGTVKRVAVTLTIEFHMNSAQLAALMCC